MNTKLPVEIKISIKRGDAEFTCVKDVNDVYSFDYFWLDPETKILNEDVLIEAIDKIKEAL